MANTIVTSSLVAKEALAALKNMCTFSANVNRKWEDEFSDNMARGYAPGATINILKPARNTYRAGRVAVPQGSVDTTIPLTLSQGGVDLNFTAFERTLSINDKRIEEKIMNAIIPIASEIDRQGLALAHYSTYNTLNLTSGAGGTLPTSQANALLAATSMQQRLDEMAAPRKPSSNRTLISSPALNGAMIQGFAGLFNDTGTLGKQFKSGMLVDSLGMQYDMDQNVDIHTNGAGTASTVNGANQTGASITVNATGAGTITRGTRITFVGCYAVNPVTKLSTGVLANFVITSDVAVGATTLPISPAIVTSGSTQNVTASPTTGQAFVILGAASTAYSCNVAYHRDAFTLAMVPMWKPPSGVGVQCFQRSDEGFTVMVTEGFDIVNHNMIIRLDVLFGWAATYPELSVTYMTAS